MKKIGENKQVIAVTHLTQVAAKGNSHYLIFKEIKSGRTNTLIKVLDRLHVIQFFFGIKK